MTNAVSDSVKVMQENEKGRAEMLSLFRDDFSDWTLNYFTASTCLL